MSVNLSIFSCIFMKSDYCNRIPEDAAVSVVFCQRGFGGTKEKNEYGYDSRSSGLWLKTKRFGTSTCSTISL